MNPLTFKLRGQLTLPLGDQLIRDAGIAVFELGVPRRSSLLNDYTKRDIFKFAVIARRWTMPQVEIPDVVFQQIEQLRPESQSAADFVLHAIQDRLAWEDGKREFYRLSDETRRSLSKQGITEADVLADFESSREALSG